MFRFERIAAFYDPFDVSSTSSVVPHELDALLNLAASGIGKLFALQAQALQSVCA